jgi:nonsense-mediated mRNA decay protein 3
MSAVHFHKDARKPSVTMTVDDISVNRSRANLTVRATLYNQPVEGTCSVEIIWHKEQCDRCNRISGSYYEGIVQVRAEGRVPGTYEIQMAASISRHVEDTLQSGGERLSFISDITEIHDGLDIVIGSQHIGLLISQGIVAQLGGRYSSHPKLVGEKNGRQLYRITYLVRLPRFQKYDVVRSGNRYYEVEKVESHHVRTFDLRDGQSKSIRENDIGRIIGNARNAEPALVVFAHGDSVGILDPGTQQTRDVRGLPWMTIRAGDHVNILRDGDEPIIVR